MKTAFNEIIKYKAIFLNAFYALLTYLAILIYFKTIFSYSSYSFLLLLVYVLLLFFYAKYGMFFKKSTKKTKTISCVFSLILSIILIAGSLVSSHVTETIGIIFNFHTIVYLFVGVLGFYIFFKNLVCIVLDHLSKFVFDEKHYMNKKTFFIISGLFLICWLPYFLRFFPAVMTPDSYYSIHYVKNGILSDFHAFGHTWFFGMFYYLGMFLFNNIYIAVSVYTIIQMIICSLIFTYVLKFLYDNGVKKIYLILLFLLFAFSPLFAIYSITLWRDVLFGMAFAVLFISLYNFVKSDYQLQPVTVTFYILAILIILFFRNNGIYVFLLFLPFLFLYTQKNKKIIVFGNILIVVLYFLIKGPIFNYFGVEKTTSVEAFSIPLQQIARVVVNEGDIDKNTYAYLNQIIDIQKVKETYDPTISDYVKRAANNNKISKEKTKFLITWFSIGMKNPQLYFESYLCSTLGYWYPDVVYWATAGESESIFNDVKIVTKSLGPNFLKYSDNFTSRKIPLSIFLWSIGLMFIILLFSVAILVYKNKTKYVIAYVPLICLWLSYMLATPVFAELRYVYGLFVCAPLLIFAPFIKDRK